VYEPGQPTNNDQLTTTNSGMAKQGKKEKNTTSWRKRAHRRIGVGGEEDRPTMIG
jgi:hypothetical protein